MDYAMKEWKENKDKGVAMVVCITIISILVIFCFSLLLVSYTLYASQNKNNQSDLNQEAAKSLADAFRQELTESNEKSNLMKYLRYNVYQNSWPFYEPGVDGHDDVDAKRYFTIEKNGTSDIAGYPGKVEVCMYWTLPEGATSFDPSADSAAKNHLHLFLEITTKSGSQSYTILSTYELSVRVGTSTYPDQSIYANFNPANNTINREEKWVWKFLGSE